jgi:hypothetical protein
MNIKKVSKRISIELDEIEQLINRIYIGLQKAKQNSDDYYLDGVALNLHNCSIVKVSCIKKIC